MLNVLTILSGLCTFAGMSAAIMDCKSDAPMPTHAPTEITVIKGNADVSTLESVGVVIVENTRGVMPYSVQAWALRTHLRQTWVEHFPVNNGSR